MSDTERPAPACCQPPPDRPDSLCEIMCAGFCGRTCWMAVIAAVYLIAFAALGVFAAVRFFDADTTDDKILYAAGFLTALVIVAVVKLWYWMLVFRLSIGRQIDRLQRRLADRADPS